MTANVIFIKMKRGIVLKRAIPLNETLLNCTVTIHLINSLLNRRIFIA